MNSGQLLPNEIVAWFHSKGPVLAPGVNLAEVRESREHIPGAVADFGSVEGIGRITAGVSRHFDFEVLRPSDGEQIFSAHERIASFPSPELENVFDLVLEALVHPTRIEKL